MYKKHGKVPVYFERNFKCQHLQLQVVPVLVDDANIVKKQCLDQAASREIDLNEVMSTVSSSFFPSVETVSYYCLFLVEYHVCLFYASMYII